MKKLVNGILGLFNLEVSRKKKKTASSYGRNQRMTGGFERWKQLGIPLNTVIDVGAAAGTWSLSARKYWPEASFVLFEPLAERKQELEELTRTHPGFHFVPNAAGPGPGEIRFVISDDLDGSGIASQGQAEANIRTVNVVSIADEVKRLGLKGPYLVKLDTHGYEVPILEGCVPIADQISLFIIECYGFQIADGSLLFWELCRHMDALGFRLFDVVDVMNRPRDGAFWQCDAFFIKKNNPLFTYNHYR